MNFFFFIFLGKIFILALLVKRMENRCEERPLYEMPNEIFARLCPMNQLREYAARYAIDKEDIRCFVIKVEGVAGLVFIREVDENSDDESYVRKIVKAHIKTGLEEIICSNVIEC